MKRAAPEAVGFTTARLEAIDATIQAYGRSWPASTAHGG
jgi:hypothetical protein